MAIDINFKQITTGNLTYKWWCDECQVSHFTPWCPYATYNEAFQNMEDGLDNYREYEICPHCGQLIKMEA